MWHILHWLCVCCFHLLNKRPMGHIAQLRKQFKSINAYFIVLIKRRKNLLSTLTELNGSSFEKTWIPFTQGCFEPNLVEIGPAVLEKKIKMWKVYDNANEDDDNDNDVQRTNFDQKSSLELRLKWAKMPDYMKCCLKACS